METKTKRRKVIQFGQNSLVITLPKEFVDKSGIKKGDRVAVTYDSLLVIVNPNLPKEESGEEK